jgi:hypothetical protein
VATIIDQFHGVWESLANPSRSGREDRRFESAHADQSGLLSV